MKRKKNMAMILSGFVTNYMCDFLYKKRQKLKKGFKKKKKNQTASAS